MKQPPPYGAIFRPRWSRVEYVLSVDDLGTERLIRDRPEGKELVTTQEVVPTQVLMTYTPPMPLSEAHAR